jgi:hypothetical protein
MKKSNQANNIIHTPALSAEQESIIRVLLYFEVFRHPLKKDEIRAFLNHEMNTSQLEALLAELESNGLVKRHDIYYFVDLEPCDIDRRVQGEERFQKAIKTAGRYCTLIANFPFVRCVCLSGSISKGVAYPQSDIDYFIITSPNRLWVSKFLLVLFKKTVLLNFHKNFCINYYIDDQHLALEEKNLFTATELATVIPRYGYDQYNKLIQQNPWIYDYFPNFQIRSNDKIVKGVMRWPKGLMEFVLDNRLGDFINSWFMKLVWRKYNRGHEHPFTPEELELMFKSKPHVSKVHHSNNQKRLLRKLEQKITAFEKRNHIKIFDSHHAPHMVQRVEKSAE